jgi:drug/metabolite transporter (DMT)-like permease
VAILLGLLAALAYGSSDFAAGLASRRLAAGPVTGVTQALGVLTTAAAVVLFPGAGPRTAALEWGALSGVGSALGTLSLYHGLAVARMTVVATLSAVLTAALPVIAGVALGNQLHLTSAAGIVLALPAIALVSWQRNPHDPRAARTSAIYGMLAGVGFALLFIALDRAGTRSGAWPLLPGQVVSLTLIAPFAYRGLRRTGRPPLATTALTVGAGVLSATANLLFLAATGHGELAVVAVLTALYPAITVLLARVWLSERWSRLQGAGLVLSAVAITLVTIGGAG